MDAFHVSYTKKCNEGYQTQQQTDHWAQIPAKSSFPHSHDSRLGRLTNLWKMLGLLKLHFREYYSLKPLGHHWLPASHDKAEQNIQRSNTTRTLQPKLQDSNIKVKIKNKNNNNNNNRTNWTYETAQRGQWHEPTVQQVKGAGTAASEITGTFARGVHSFTAYALPALTCQAVGSTSSSGKATNVRHPAISPTWKYSRIRLVVSVTHPGPDTWSAGH